MLSDGVKEWRSVVQEELDKAGYPLPPEYPLALIQRESNGIAGAQNPHGGDSGLMQVRPIALRDYNDHHSEKYSMTDLRGKDASSARIQIRVGIWILANFMRVAFKYLQRRLGEVSLDDLVKITDTFYAMGPAGAKKKLDTVKPKWTIIKARYPDWHRIKPAERIWDTTIDEGAQWKLDDINQWLSSDLVDENKKTIGGAALALLILAFGFLWLKGRMS